MTSRKAAMKAAVDAAMTVAEDVVGGRVQPAALEAAAVAECRALFGAVSGLEDPLAPLQLDVARQVLAAGWIPASELAEWLAVAQRRDGDADSDRPASTESDEPPVADMAAPATGVAVAPGGAGHELTAGTAELGPRITEPGYA